MTVICPACGLQSEVATFQIPDHEYGLHKVAHFATCSACGTVFQNPMPSESELASFYPADYHSMTHAGLLNRIKNQTRASRLIRLSQSKGPLLDFGCGDGAFLVQASKMVSDRELWGYEIGEQSSVETLNHGKVKIVRGSLRDLVNVVPACSLITMNHVIEHLSDPFSTVLALANLLLPGGVLEGQTPVADSLERRLFGKKWSGYHAPRHTVVFSRGGLIKLLERCELQSPDVRGAFNPAGIAVSLGSLSHSGNGGRIRRTGPRWLLLIGMATALAPFDLFLNRPGIVNFSATRVGR